MRGASMTKAKPREYPSIEIERFVRRLEELVERRKKQWGKRRLGCQRWTWEDLLAQYPYLRYVRLGRTQNPPRRDAIMELASYMRCTLDERNQLLLAAGWCPEMPHVSDELFDQTVKGGDAILHQLSMPAFVVTRSLDIACWNPYAPTLFGLTEEQVLGLVKKEKKLNILYFIFDPELHLRSVWQSKSPKHWKYTAKLNIQLFKRANMLSQYDNWYREFENDVEHSKLPDFWDMWNQVKVDEDNFVEGFDKPISDYVTILPRPSGDFVHIRGLMIRYNEYNFPRIIAYIPNDTATIEVFSRIGLPTPDKWST